MILRGRLLLFLLLLAVQLELFNELVHLLLDIIIA
jgi:hypothetical protein